MSETSLNATGYYLREQTHKLWDLYLAPTLGHLWTFSNWQANHSRLSLAHNVGQGDEMIKKCHFGFLRH